MQKKGFTLVETVVAIAIILIITTAFYSLASYVNLSTQRAQATINGINESKNVLTIFEQADFVEGGQFSLEDFETKLNWVYGGINIDMLEEDEYTFQLTYNTEHQRADDGMCKYNFYVSYNVNQVEFTAKIYFNEKLLYEMPEKFTKVVSA